MRSITRVFLLSLVCILGVLPTVAQAQSPNWAFPSHVLLEGKFRNLYNYGGAKPHVVGCFGYEWPAWYRYTCHQTGMGLWLAAKNFTDGSGRTWTHKVAHIGYRNTGAGEFFPTDLQKTVGRRPRPRVYVDGLNSFRDPIVYDEINRDLKAAGKVITQVTAVNGLTLTRTIRAFSQKYHDDYHIIEYVLKNTGDTDGDGQRDVPKQTLEDVYLAQFRNFEVNQMAGSIAGSGSGWGRTTMNEVSMGDGLKEYNEDLRAQFSWLGYVPEFTDWNTIGGPALDDDFGLIFPGDSLGRLTAGHMVGFATLHADKKAHPPGQSSVDDPNQPSIAGYISNGSPLNSNSHQNVEKMAQEYMLLEEGNIALASPGSHADLIVGPPASDPEPKIEWRRRMANQTADPGVDIEGMIHMTIYGPYDMEYGEVVRIVQVVAVGGLSPEADFKIGKAYKEAVLAGNGDKPIAFDADGDGTIEADEKMSKNMWVMTSRDSLFKTFRRAKANWESGFNIPQPPPPPSEFRVRSGPNQIMLEWKLYEFADTPVGFELYRGSLRPENDPAKIHYELIAGVDELGPNARSYKDTEVTRGIPYFYYLQVVGEVNQDPTANTPTGVRLKSNRIYTQTYDPARLKRPEGEELADARVVPNPYTITSDQSVRWPGQRDRIGFLDIPGNCTIRIYTESGQLVETIKHTDGSGDEYWDLTTASNQIIASGIYGAVITDLDTGRQIIRKFVVIR